MARPTSRQRNALFAAMLASVALLVLIFVVSLVVLIHYAGVHHLLAAR